MVLANPHIKLKPLYVRDKELVHLMNMSKLCSLLTTVSTSGEALATGTFCAKTSETNQLALP